MMRRLVVATRNRGKLVEIEAIMRIDGLCLSALGDWPAAPTTQETGSTFLENAMLKAMDAARFTGLPAIADDSGLCVDALDGAPGVLSARFGGPGLDDVGRYELLLNTMRDVPEPQRGARFVCAVALAMPDGKVHTATGELRGSIAISPRGAGGFGYDPVFFLPDRGCTVAELPEEVKNAVSHRATALRAIAPYVRVLVNSD
ncbi:MAG: dITP/XTP pyrophosphatase [Firmicutes bacterium ADurb.Bin506]|nr:MAG: dITP/XTP pyrophosphatase [Firmicutes bacterium ADurb.Bin506]